MGKLFEIGLFGLILIFTANADAPADEFAITGKNAFTDQSGRNITIQKPFTRIISLYAAHTENLFRLGLDDEIIGVSRGDVFPKERIEQKPVFSYHDDPEKFLAAMPDLVLTRPMIERGYAMLTSRLEKSGVTVASLQPAGATGMYDYWRILGMLAGKTDRAENMIAAFDQAAAKFKSLTSHIRQRKKVYFEAIHSRMKTFSPEAMAVFALETAGGINIASDAEPVRGTNIAAYGKERILSIGQDIDVYLAQTGAMNRPTVSEIMNEPGFQFIKAVQNGQVYLVDEMIVSRPTFRLLQGVRDIGILLHPDVFTPAAAGIVHAAEAF